MDVSHYRYKENNLTQPLPDVYIRLAAHLDDLPAGYPRTDSGVELKILRKLFSAAEAELALHLTLLNEEARVVAFRAHLQVEHVSSMLAEMAHKGLVSLNHVDGKPPTYSISQFVVGFWEDQVNRLDRELVELFEQYAPQYFVHGPWTSVPQIRTIPVHETIPVTSAVLPYERAEEIIRANTVFAVRNCVCRQEHHLLDHQCGKPLETCLSFGNAAANTAKSGKGRLISQEEALAVLKTAERHALVLQPANSQNPAFLCACCGCCCGVLRNIKHHAKPADLVANAFIANYDADLCIECGACLDRCQMEALTQPQGTMSFNVDRCIGCGLCVSECPTGAMTLVRKPISEQPKIPLNTLHTYVKMGWQRRKMTPGSLVSLALRSGVDRLLAPRRK